MSNQASQPRGVQRLRCLVNGVIREWRWSMMWRRFTAENIQQREEYVANGGDGPVCGVWQ